MAARDRLTMVRIKGLESGKYADGGGLWLHKREDGGAQWFYRYSMFARRREMGLGSLTDVSLKEARETADKWRAVVRSGRDPIIERDRQKREATTRVSSLADVTTLAFEARKASLKGDGAAGRWLSPLQIHVLPKIGKVPIDQIDQNVIQRTISPIWKTKTETARKALDRLSIVFQHAAAMGLNADMQAVTKARALLGAIPRKQEHVPSIPYPQMPAFYATLAEPTITHLALRLLILTATRSSEVRLAHIDEIDLDTLTWSIPAKRTKMNRAFRVPLSIEAKSVIEFALRHSRDGFLFPSAKKGVISDMTMSQYMKRRKLDARPHGFRSTFRTWAAEQTDAPREIAETCLAHLVDSKVEQAYRRTDYLDQRRKLMQSWTDYVVSVKS